MNTPRTRPLSRQYAAWLLLAATATILTFAGVLSTRDRAGAAPGPSEPTYVVPVKGVDPDAKGVDSGNKKQASGVKMRRVPKDSKEESHKRAGKYGRYGGCTPDYGLGKGKQQCLPPNPPAAVAMGMTVEEMPWTCPQVLELFPAGITLTKKGTDPAGLDSNEDGVACDRGD